MGFVYPRLRLKRPRISSPPWSVQTSLSSQPDFTHYAALDEHRSSGMLRQLQKWAVSRGRHHAIQTFFGFFLPPGLNLACQAGLLANFPNELRAAYLVGDMGAPNPVCEGVRMTLQVRPA